MLFSIVPRFRHATVYYACPASAWAPFLLSVGSASHSVLCYAFTSGFCSLCGTPILESKRSQFSYRRRVCCGRCGLTRLVNKSFRSLVLGLLSTVYSHSRNSLAFCCSQNGSRVRELYLVFCCCLGGMHCMHLWRLSLLCDFPQAFGIACILPSFELFLCLNLVLSSPCGAGEIRKALPRLLSYPTVVGR